MQDKLKSLDLGPIGFVEMENGKLPIPRLSNSKLIKIAKFIGIDGMRLYEQFKGIIADPELSESEKWVTILTELPEETVIHLLSIMLEIEDEEALALDPIVTLEIIAVYAENINLSKAFTVVRSLAKKIFKVEIPDVQTLLSKIPSSNGETLSTSLSAASN